MKYVLILIISIILITVSTGNAHAGILSKPVQECGEYILKKFGKGAAGKTAREISQNTATAVAKYGDDCLPLLRSAGHEGFEILERAGRNAPDVIRLHRTHGDRALWVLRDRSKTSLYFRHGDSAAEAIIKHPGIADDFIRSYGVKGAQAFNTVSRQNAQRLSRLTKDGTLAKTGKADEIIDVVIKYGDEAMKFIWRNKGALTVTSALVVFLNNPEVYIEGARRLLVEPVAAEIMSRTNWTLIICLCLSIVFLPYIVKRLTTARAAARATQYSQHPAQKSDIGQT